MNVAQDNLGAASDDVYDTLLAAFDGLNEQEQHAKLARLALIMVNYIGDIDVVQDMLDLAQTPAS